ncbi:hypothetical protein [Klebsiella pneumoniae]|uniref:hypothetical protein n=1 Tax=Klebsiella pneumoniae TaxID=573 RepID=UPI001D0D96FE|nr:hypothetical protein [Klebsiella pneumoniae]
MTDITELAQRMKAAAEKATPGEWWADEVKTKDATGLAMTAWRDSPHTQFMALTGKPS